MLYFWRILFALLCLVQHDVAFAKVEKKIIQKIKYSKR